MGGLSLVATSRGYSLVLLCGLLTAVASLLQSTGSTVCRFQELWLMGSVVVAPGLFRAQAQRLWHTGLAAPRHVGPSQIRDPTGVTCICNADS